MRINRLTVKNFKGFASKTFELPRPLDAAPGNGSMHVLIGQNGRGKTSALDALAVAAGSWFLGVRGEGSRHIQESDVRIQVNAYLGTQRIEQQLPVVVEAEGEVLGEAMRWARELKAKRTRWVRAKALKARAEHAVAAAQRGETVILPLISYYGTGRLWLEPRDMQPGVARPDDTNGDDVGPDEPLADDFASRLAGYRFSIDPRCSPRELLRWLSFEHRIAQDEGRPSPQYLAVKEAIRRSVEGCIGVEQHARLGLLLEIEGQGRLPFGALSDGQRSIVAMTGDLAYKAAQLNPHLEDVLSHTPGIVLIDEVDLHLHPRWQQHILEDLRGIFPEVQFVVTTHSPFIVQSARPGELVSLDAQPVEKTDNLGIEEIARGLMHVEHPDVSARYRTMVDAAKDYLVTLDKAAQAPDDTLATYLDRLADTVAPYADNPAYQAFLELKREARLGGRGARPER